MSKYAVEQQDVLEAIAEDGGVIVFPDAIPGTPRVYDDLHDTWSGGTGPTDATSKALQMEDDPMRFQRAGLVTTNPVTLLIAAKPLIAVGVTLAPGMRAVWGGRPVTIADVETLDPAGDGAIYYDVVGSA